MSAISSLNAIRLLNAAKTFIVKIVADPTANRVITFQDKTYTVAGLDDLPSINGFRLTLTSNTPVTTSDVTAASTVYLTPYLHKRISLYDGSKWIIVSSSEASISLSGGTASMPHDVFCYLNNGALAFDLVPWSSWTARATALAYQDGVLVKSTDTTRRYLGSVYLVSDKTTEDSELKRYLFNYYNRVVKSLIKIESTATWTYSTASFRQANNSSSNAVRMMVGVSEDVIECLLSLNYVTNSTAAGRDVEIAIGLDSATTQATGSVAQGTRITSSVRGNLIAKFNSHISVGYHYLTWLEKGAGADTQTWSSSSKSGLLGKFLC